MSVAARDAPTAAGGTADRAQLIEDLEQGVVPPTLVETLGITGPGRAAERGGIA